MSKSHQSFNRRERERAKKAKANDKRQRRLERPEATDGAEGDAPGPAPVDQGALLQQLADLSAAVEAGDLDFDAYDEQRAALIALIEVD